MRKDVHEKCLVLYPDSVWNEQVDRMRQSLNRWNKQQQQVFRMFVAEAEVVTLDNAGRFLLSRKMQERAGIGDVVRLIGVGDTIEIWPMGSAGETFMDADMFGDAMEKLMATVADGDTGRP